MPRNWHLTEQTDAPPALREAVGGHPLVAHLLTQRGFTDPGQAAAFLDPSLYVPASPYELEGMDKTVALLRKTISRGQRVRIWGDFDVDGQTATAVLYEALAAAGADVDYQVPRRHEGHGFHMRAIDDALRDGVSTLITCDTGIGDVDTVARGVAEGLVVIVTDHHDLPEAPPAPHAPHSAGAHAVIDPKMLARDHPLHDLTGVGVTYMVARALLEGSEQSSRRCGRAKRDAARLDAMLDLVALGLVADVATQVGDTRYLIQRGLAALRQTRRPGLRALAQEARLDLAHLTELDIGYQLGPRLNAAGRLADATIAVDLLLTQDAQVAQDLAGKLEALNHDRQAYTEAVQAQVAEMLRRQPDILDRPAIIIEGKGWVSGVLGLVAGKLAREYNRPAMLILHQEGSASTASARSVEGVDIHRAIASQREHLLKEGGHPMAAGFSIEPDKVAQFKRGLWSWLEKEAPPRELAPPLAVEASVPWEEIDLHLAQEVRRLAPFGAGNPRPLLMTSGGTLVRVEDVSRRRETPHRNLYLNDDSARPLRFTWFNAREMPQVGERLDVAFHVEVNHWKGRDQLRLELADWRSAVAPVGESVAALVAGREVLDWRAETDVEPLLARLRAQYGEALVVWAEGLATPVAGTMTRRELAAHPATALAILTAPPGPEALRWVLAQVQPQVLELLPPCRTAEPSPKEFLTKVVGMLRVALRAHGGQIDAMRMAARVGARRAAVVAALRWLEAKGKIALGYETDGLHAYFHQDAPPEPEWPGEALESDAQWAVRKQRAQEQAASSLIYLLRESRAYRRAYATEPVAALLCTKG